MKKVFDRALAEDELIKDEYISSEHLLIALAESPDATGTALKTQGVTRGSILDALRDVRGTHRASDPQAESRYESLRRFARDLNELARRGGIEPVIGRGEESRRERELLSLRTSYNAVRVVEAGLGQR